MSKILLALLFTLLMLTLAACTGARKIPGKYGFYSTKSPALSIKFNGLEYQGEFKETKNGANVHTYYYLDPDGKQAAWVELIDIKQGWRLPPKKVPGAKLSNTGIYSKEVAGNSCYARTFLVQPETAKRGFAAMSSYTAIRICTKLISQSQKISIGYAGEVNSELAEEIFSSSNYGELTQAQRDFFAAFEKRADTAVVMDKFQKGDVEGKIEHAAMLSNPWYRFTDFMPLKQQIEKISR